MIYIENENNIGLYEVKIDKEKLAKVKEKIMANCCLITSKITEKMTDTQLSNMFNCSAYKVLSYKVAEAPTYTTFYVVVYQQKIYPTEISIIDSLLWEVCNFEKAIFELDCKHNLKEEALEETKAKKYEVLSKLENLNIDTNNICKELEIIKNDLMILSKNYSFENLDTIKPVSDYYDEIMECIQLLPIKIISKGEYNNLRALFQHEVEIKQMTPNVKKLIKMKK